MSSCHVAILGSGPAGLGAAFRLAQTKKASATVLEKQSCIGGLAGSFDIGGIRADFGSHRLHPSCSPAIMSDIRQMLGDDLLDRPRHGRIRLRGRWIHFPLKPVDLLVRTHPGFALGAVGDMLRKMLPNGSTSGQESFATVLQRGLGKTICRDFYFPYARKIWGMAPEELSAIQAKRRVKAGSLGKIVTKILSAIPGLKPKGGGRFFYPRQGFGQIVDAYARAARDAGANIQLGADVQSVMRLPDGKMCVEHVVNQKVERLEVDFVWSTIPVTHLVNAIRPEAPLDIRQACEQIRYRSMILIYLVVKQPQFTEFDAHYFPETAIPITRLSEPKNYCVAPEPADRTVLCAELPCSRDDAYWSMSDEQLAGEIKICLEKLGLPLKGDILEVTTRRLPNAYPIYQIGYETAFEKIDQYLNAVPNLVTLGRQGLFAHDNTHHTLAMAYAAVDCLDSHGTFNVERWQQFRKGFEEHVVED